MMSLHRKQSFLVSILVVLIMILGACGDDGDAGEPEVVTGDTVTVVAETPVVADSDVMTDTEASAETDVESTTEVESEVIVDTNVITQTEVFTETDITEVITETEVITDVNVMTDTQTVQDSATITEENEIDSSEAVVLILFTDTAGNRYLADEEGQPIFAYTGSDTPPMATENFAPLQGGANVVVGEGLDATMFVEDEASDNQLTYNGLPLYRFVGEGDPMQLATEQEMSPLAIEE